MENRVEKTIERHKKGYNCAQAVVCTYCDLLNAEEQDAFRMSEGFGAGMGLPNMKKYTDSMTIDTTVGVGTTITMTVEL